MPADLHIHTYYSDGSQAPEDIIAMAKKLHLSPVSVCDHNTIGAYNRLRAAAKAENVHLVQGVELDVRWQDKTLHLLGYAFDPDHPDMQALLAHQMAESDRFDRTFIENLAADFPQISLADYNVFSPPHEIGGWKNTNYAVARGAAQDIPEALGLFSRYATYMTRFAPIQDACSAIANAGGVPVLAHPGNWWHSIPYNFSGILKSLLKHGVRGIECFYPSHTEEMTRTCVDFCRAHGLAITCGGDGHGTFNRVIEGVTYDIGVMDTPSEKLNLRGIA